MKFQNAFLSLRPRQWLKNILVSLAFFMSTLELSVSNFVIMILGIVTFCFASSLGYLVNDWIDKDLDKSHPKKGRRVFASGALKFKGFLVIFISVSFILFLLVLQLPFSFRIAILIYFAITFSYSLWIKKIAVIEMLWLPLGFLIRAYAGALLFSIPVTGWFLIVTFFGSLFIVSSKRYAELSRDDNLPRRGVLNSYTRDFLQSVSTVALSVTLSVYGLWAFQVSKNTHLAMLSMFPISLALIRYLWHRDRGDAETPEELLIKDWVFIVCGVSAISLVFPSVR
jgi:decaprenyl-phosphate phosphoribosyltransferase